MNAGGKTFVLFLLLVFALTGIHYTTRRSRSSLILLFALIMQFGNYMLIALVEPVLWRYNVYTNQVLFTLLALSVVYKPLAKDTIGTSDDLSIPAVHRNAVISNDEI